jgi:integrase
MATLRKRGSKWHVQVRRSGQSMTRSFTHKADAEAWGRKIERDIDTGDLSDTDRLSRVVLRELLERYSSEVIPKKRSGVIEQFFVDRFLRHPIAALPLSRLSPIHISQYRDERLQVVTGSTVHRELGVLRHVFEVARKDWGIPLKSNPVHGITMPSVGRPRERRVSEAELSSLRLTCSHQLLWQVITIALETGMRRGEIVNMRWEDIDWEVGTLHIPVTKNGHPRTIPLTGKALETLRELPRTDEAVFSMTGNAVRLAWVRLKEKAGVVDLRFHDLRHEAVSRFFEMGLSIPEVALISGHRDPRMLFRYTV